MLIWARKTAAKPVTDSAQPCPIYHNHPLYACNLLGFLAALLSCTSISFLSVKVLVVDVSADFAMMIPDYSAGPWASAGIVSIDAKILAAKAKQAKAATEKLLQSDAMQSHFQDALKQRDSQRDPAAPDSTKSDALHALTEATRQSADGTSDNSTSRDSTSGDSTPAAESSTAASESTDAGQQERSRADKWDRMNARLLGQPAGNVITGQLGPA